MKIFRVLAVFVLAVAVFCATAIAVTFKPAQAKSHHIRNALIIGGVLMAAHHLSHRSPAYGSEGGGGGDAPRDERAYPDTNKTPGDVLPVTADDVCIRGYSKSVRNVPISVKRQVYANYGIQYVRGADEVDHLISLELGGSNSIKNLWPEPYVVSGKYAGWGAHQKDLLENKLHKLVCSSGTSDEKNARLKQAQQLISHDWIAAYKRFIGPEPKPDTTNYRN